MMSKKPCKRVLASMERQPWAIRPDMLGTLLAIAQRQYSNRIEASDLHDQYVSSGVIEEPGNIAIIDVMGPIFARADFFSDISGAATCEHVAADLSEAVDDPSITGIILRFDSPGGEVTGTHELAHQIYQSRDIKPLVAYVSGSACSAAYWLASATSYIFCDRTSSLGSIGVVAAWTDDTAARESDGLVDYEVVSSQSPNKRLDPTSDEGKAALQLELDGLADIFISDVAMFRGVAVETVLADFGQGGTLLADAAIDAGLADELGSLRDVVSILSNESDPVAATPKRGSSMAGFKRNFYGNKAARLAARRAEGEPQTPENDNEVPPDDPENPSSETPNTDPDEPDANEDEDDENREAIEDEEDPEAEEEDQESETTATHRRVNQLARTKPSLYRAILRRGARRERRRIEGIEGLSAPGRESAIQSAKFSSPKTIGATSRAILRSERSMKTKRENDYRSDADFRVQSTPGVNSGQSDSTVAAEKSVLEQISMGAKTKLGLKMGASK